MKESWIISRHASLHKHHHKPRIPRNSCLLPPRFIWPLLTVIKNRKASWETSSLRRDALVADAALDDLSWRIHSAQPYHKSWICTRTVEVLNASSGGVGARISFCMSECSRYIHRRMGEAWCWVTSPFSDPGEKNLQGMAHVFRDTRGHDTLVKFSVVS
jgi:hypothetical protein